MKLRIKLIKALHSEMTPKNYQIELPNLLLYLPNSTVYSPQTGGYRYLMLKVI